jgi:hypothetical protein
MPSAAPGVTCPAAAVPLARTRRLTPATAWYDDVVPRLTNDAADRSHRGTDGPPFALPQWLKAAVPDYPLPLMVEVWGGYTLDRSANGTLRKVVSTDGMSAIVGGAYYLDQDLPRPFRPGSSALAKSQVYQAPCEYTLPSVAPHFRAAVACTCQRYLGTADSQTH